MKHKLMNSRGESIAESLVSVLVVALASILFAGMVTASSRIIDDSTEWMQTYYNAVSEINNTNSEDNGNTPVKIYFSISAEGNSTYQIVTPINQNVGGVTIVSYKVYKDSTTP